MGNTRCLFFIILISESISTNTCLGARYITAVCSKQERLALIKFKNSVKDEFGMLSSWGVGNDCCRWERVTCDNATGSVIGLSLKGNVMGSFRDEGFVDDLDSELVEDHYSSTNDFSNYFAEKCYQLVGGEVNSCLAELRHLNYLDLSWNDFQGSHIPEFIGSFENLSYLNLSNAGFGGIIPSHIGNLSNLKVLDFSSSYTKLIASEMTTWVSGLLSLDSLNLNDVDLSGAQNIHRLLYMIPSLLKLSLSGCSLSNANFVPYLNSSTKQANIKHLDLSYNNFQDSPLPKFLQNMTSLAFLDISGYNLSQVWNSENMLNMIPSVSELHLSHCKLQKINFFPTYLNFSTLSNIQHLDLSWNHIEGRFTSVLTNLSSLLSLDLSYNFLNSSIPVMPKLLKLDLSGNTFGRIEDVGIWRQCHLMELISSHILHGETPIVGPSANASECSQYAFEILNLRNNNLNSSISESFERLTNLRHLDLSYNKLTGPIPEALCRTRSLEVLDLSYNKLTGSIPKALGKLRSLKVLDLSYNDLTGPISEALGNLRSLQVLELSSNYLTGPIPKFHGQLTKLRLSYNRLNGTIPDSLGRFIDLTELLLQSNWLTGHIPLTLGKLTSLQVFSVSSNLLNGTIPVSFGQLTKLYLFDASNNSLQGLVSEAQFANLSALKYLNTAYNNQLTFNVSRNWIPPFQLNIVYLNSCNISDEFPHWFQTQQNLRELVLSDTSISGPLPTWLRRMPIIRVLDLSYNELTGTLKNLPSGDLLNGVGYQAADILLMQDNWFTGSIPRLLCRRTDLTILDLSRNRLTGTVPECLGNLKSLMKILLGSNNLSGSLPSSLGRISSSLTWLQLNDNNFGGELPNEYRNFIYLDVLDLGENKISGKIPEWIGKNLTFLTVLRLHQNNFTGKIPKSLCRLDALHILDLAHNSFTGSIPHCFGKLRGMITLLWSAQSPQYDGKLMQVIKGAALEYTTMWKLVSNMDLSGNKLVGKIPQELTMLTGLLGLNLSHNLLGGVIPNELGNMKSLFSLDFSANELTGRIPPSIAILNFLSHLNLSHNNLSGQIPTGKQLQTLTDPSIYAGNRHLCGAPLQKKCSNHENPPIITSTNISEDASKPKNLWFYLDIMSGFATGFWGITGILYFKKQWRHKLFMISEVTIERIHVAVAIRVSKMRRGRKVV